MKYIIIILMLIIAVLWYTRNEPSVTILAPEVTHKLEEVITNAPHVDAAKRCVMAKLRDPDSARFTNIRVGEHTIDGTAFTVVTGFVKSKNGYGGYGDAVHFYSGGTVGTTMLGDFTADFLEAIVYVK